MKRSCTLFLPLCICLSAVQQAAAGETNWAQCATKFDKKERLACYDQLASGKKTPRSHLTAAWDLDGQGSLDVEGVRRLEPYRKNYVLINHDSSINAQPSSPAPNHTVATPYNYQTTETKFQFSFKAEIGNTRDFDFLSFTNFRIWAGYTQQSYWQMFNSAQSSPFRETNYEPELIGTLGTNGARWKLLNIGLVHQSNGQSDPQSRSWNRLYLQGGWEWDDIYVLGRGWWRIPESSSTDDNPDITNYLGRGDLLIHWSPDQDDEVMLLLRSNLNSSNHKGYFQLDWSTPVRIWHLSKLSFQLSSGYGDSLIDYNHNQTTFGIGFTFKEW